MLKDGILYCNALSKEACPVDVKSFEDNTSIGSADVVLLLGAVLVPVTTT